MSDAKRERERGRESRVEAKQSMELIEGTNFMALNSYIHQSLRNHRRVEIGIGIIDNFLIDKCSTVYFCFFFFPPFSVRFGEKPIYLHYSELYVAALAAAGYDATLNGYSRPSARQSRMNRTIDLEYC